MKRSTVFLCIAIFYIACKNQSATAAVVCSEEILVTKFKNPSGPGKKEAFVSKSMTLIDKNKNTLLLEDLLKKHQGKIVYIDFWASWCKPCLTALPSSIKLRETLKDLPVVFVYLSIDEKRRRWKKAGRKEKLKNYPESYLVLNSEESEFLKKYKFNSIPRYMIFDQHGELVDAMAAGPVNEDAESVLKKLAELK